MYDSLIEYFLGLEEEELSAIEIEEAALVSAWLDSQPEDEISSETRDSLQERINFWASNPRIPTTDTEGRRLQPLLREVLDRAIEEGPDQLHRNEFDLLAHTYGLIEQAVEADQYSRLSQYFEKNIATIHERRENLPAVPGLVGLEPFLRIVTAEEIVKAPRKNVNSFAGVALPGRGPLLRHRGNLKVMGHVPDDTMVVAENGKCLVHGYVFGRVAATFDCEVRDNISGVVVVSLGDVRARMLLTGSFVVSKWGQSVARNTENPKLVFGGKLIRIRGDADGGHYAAPEIIIEGPAHSGEFCVSQRLSAEEFERADTRSLDIVLRRTITPEDYGGLVDPVATKLLSSIRRKRRRRDAWKDMIAMAENEARHFALNGIRFMTGGEQLLKGLEAMDAQERELSFCIRVLSALDSIMGTIEDQIAASLADSSLTGEEAILDSSLLIREVSHELKDIVSRERASEELEAPLADLEEVIAAVSRAEKSGLIPEDLFGLIRDRADRFSERRGQLIESLERKAAAIEKLLGDAAYIAENKDLSEIVVLKRLIKAASQRPPQDALHKRMQSNFLKVMLRSIDMRKDRVKQYTEMVNTIEKEIDQLSDTLEQEAKIPAPPERETQVEPPYAEGRFGAGVVICIERYLINAKNPPKGSRLVTESSGGERVTYQRDRNRVRQNARDQESA